jgi:hypothetical protein
VGCSADRATKCQLRCQGLIQRTHEVTGPRGFREIFEELIRHGLLDEAALDRALTAYAALDPRIAKALGADRLPARPPHIVGLKR